MNIEELIADARKQGLYLSNLFELGSTFDSPDGKPRGNGQWQSNFRHANGWYDYGRGDTPLAAIKEGLARCGGLKGPENRPIPKAVKPEKAEEDAVDMEDFLS